MNNILSIDLDIIFSPYIGIYNSSIKPDQPDSITWKSIMTGYDIEEFIPNEQYINLICSLINKYINQVDKVYIGLDHSSILEAIELEKNNLIQPYKFILHNIDYHHDIFYGEEQAKRIMIYNTASCSNWVGFLTINNFLTQYNWYYGLGSYYNQVLLEKECRPAIPNLKMIPFQDIDLDNNIDILFICISPSWIPPHSYELLKNIIEIIPKEKRYYLKYPYFIGNEEKNFLTLQRKSSYNYFNDFLENGVNCNS